MSLEVHVFLNRLDLPSSEAWSTGLREAEFPVTFAASFDPLKSSGFVPCTFEGADAGFEYSLSETDEVASAYPDLQHRVLVYDSAVTFRWGSRLRECATALLAASILTELTSGVLFDPQENLQIDAAQVHDYGDQTLVELRAMMTRFPSG